MAGPLVLKPAGGDAANFATDIWDVPVDERGGTPTPTHITHQTVPKESAIVTSPPTSTKPELQYIDTHNDDDIGVEHFGKGAARISRRAARIKSRLRTGPRRVGRRSGRALRWGRI